MEHVHAACLGAGVTGAGRAAASAASSRSGAIDGSSPQVKAPTRTNFEIAWLTLMRLGLRAHGTPDAVSFYDSAAAAVEDASFVQEYVPERDTVKRTLFAEISARAPRSCGQQRLGTDIGQLQGDWNDSAPLVLGHPLNPPHLVPLVEVRGNARTGPGIVNKAATLYESIGKITIRVTGSTRP